MREERELNAQLAEHLSFLETSCREFDLGKRHEAKRIANSIYTVVFDKGRTKSILTQLNWKEKVEFIASGAEYIPPKDKTKMRFRTPPLVMIRRGSKGIEYVPRLGLSSKNHRLLTFDQWWSKDTIFSDQKQTDGSYDEQRMSREALIRSLTDQDGGRHLDPKLSDSLYRRFKERRDFTGATTGELIELYPELVSARQIGWELLESLKWFGFSNFSIKNLAKRKAWEISGGKLRFTPHENIFLGSGLVLVS